MWARCRVGRSTSPVVSSVTFFSFSSLLVVSRPPHSTEGLVLVPMEPEDLDDVLALEALCFPTPWTRQMFVEELAHPWAFLEVIRPADSGQGDADVSVIAYQDFWIVPGEVHLLSIAVHPDYRRRGLGVFFLERLVKVGRRASAERIVLEVRQSNESAKRLYERFGFEFSRVRKGYYSDTGEDAIEMIFQLPRDEDVD